MNRTSDSITVSRCDAAHAVAPLFDQYRIFYGQPSDEEGRACSCRQGSSGENRSCSPQRRKAFRSGSPSCIRCFRRYP